MELRELLVLEQRLATQRRALEMISRARRAADLLEREYGADVYLFGSLAKGTVHSRSDIDLLVSGSISETQKTKIVRRIEDIAMPYCVDVLFADEINGDLVSNIKKRGIRLTC